MSSIISLLYWIVLFFMSNYDVIEATCSFPMNSGTWLSTDKGSLSFTSTRLSNYGTTSFGALNVDCHSSSGTQYVVRSDTFSLNRVDVRVYMCFILNRVNNYQYYYYLGSEEDASLSNERMKIVASSASVSVGDICDRTVYPAGSYFILVQDGYASQAASTCSTYIQADWTYTYTDTSGNMQCTSDSELNVCTNKNTLSFNYTACSQNIMYSAGGELYCLFSSVGGSMVYQHVYNQDITTDESTTYNISCLVISLDGSTRYLTQYPNNCYDGQTSKTVVSPGASLVFSLTNACPYTKEDSYTASIALGILIPLALIIVIAIIVYKMYTHYQENKEVPTPTPDPKYANGEIKNTRMSTSVGGRNDEKEMMLDSPHSVEICIDSKYWRPDSTATSDNGSVGIRRESSIRLDMNPSTRGTMVVESLPEMSELEEFSSETSDSEDDMENPKLLQTTDEYLDETKEEGTQTPNIPQILVDSVEQPTELAPDLVAPMTTSVSLMNADATQPEKKKKRKRSKRFKSASSLKRSKSAFKRNSTSPTKGILKQKPDCYGNTDEKLVVGTRVSVLKIRPKISSFMKRKQVDPLITDDSSPIDSNIFREDEEDEENIKRSDEDNNTENKEIEDKNNDKMDEKDTENINYNSENNEIKEIPDETINTSQRILKKNDSMLSEKTYKVTHRDGSIVKRRKKLPKLRHPLERKKSGTPESISQSWFKHKHSTSMKSKNSFTGKDDNDTTVSHEVDEYDNFSNKSENREQKRPPTQQKPFVNPKTETTEEVFEKLKDMWHFGNKWHEQTYMTHSQHT